MDERSRVTFCSSCGGETPWGSRFCSACGAPIDPAAAAPVVTQPIPQPPPVAGAGTHHGPRKRPPPRRRSASARPTSGLLGGLFHGVGAGLGCLGVGLAALVVIGIAVSGAFRNAGEGRKESSTPRKLASDLPAREEPERGKPQEVFALGDSVTVGDLVLRAHGPRRGKVPLADDWSGKPQASVDDLLTIDLSVKNASTTQLLTYEPLGAEMISFRRKASLKDEFGNEYKRIHFGFGGDVQGAAKRQTVYPGASVSDVLVFELPIERATTLTLSVPLHALGVEQEVQFRFSVSAIQDRR